MTYELRHYLYEVDSDDLVGVSINDWPAGLSTDHVLDWLRFHVGTSGFELWMAHPEAPDDQVRIGMGFRWPDPFQVGDVEVEHPEIHVIPTVRLDDGSAMPLHLHLANQRRMMEDLGIPVTTVPADPWQPTVDDWLARATSLADGGYDEDAVDAAVNAVEVADDDDWPEVVDQLSSIAHDWIAAQRPDLVVTLTDQVRAALPDRDEDNLPDDLAYPYANALSDLGRVDDALAVYVDLRDRAAAAGDDEHVGQMEMEIGLSLDRVGDHRGALARFEIAERIADEHDDWFQQALLAINMSASLRALGRTDEAADRLEVAIEVLDELDDERYALDARFNLANIHWEQGRFAEAGAFYEHAVVAYEQLGLSEQVADALDSLGGVEHVCGRHARARDLHARALAIYEEAGAVHERRLAAQNLGHVLGHLGEYDAGRRALHTAVEVAEDLANLAAVSEAWGFLTLLECQAGDAAAAEACLAKARETSDRSGAQTDQSAWFDELTGAVLNAQARFVEAVPVLERAVQRREASSGPWAAIDALRDLAVALAGAGEQREATRVLERIDGLLGTYGLATDDAA